MPGIGASSEPPARGSRRGVPRSVRSLEVVAVAGDPDRARRVDGDRVAALDAVERDARRRRPGRSGPRRASQTRSPTRDRGRRRRAPRRASASAPPPRARPGRRGAGGRERGARATQVVGRRAGELAEHALEQAGVLLAGADVVAREQRAGERGVGRDAERSRARRARGPAGAARSRGRRRGR